MENNEYCLQTINELLNQKSPLVLASIVSQQGSSPRHIGARMVIDSQGKIYATIGGGTLEANVIRGSLKALATGQSSLIDFDLTSQDVYSDRNICGGKATVLLDYIAPSQENIDFFQNSYQKLARGEETTLLTIFETKDSSVIALNRCMLDAGGNIIGKCPLSEADLDNLRNAVRNIQETATVSFNNSQVLVDPIHKTKTLFCVGAGHVAKPTAQLAAMVGFRVVVIDDRAEFANLERFPDAGDVRIIDDYTRALSNLDIDSDAYIIIFTRGHRFDFEVLEQAIQTRASYIGMIASRKKRETIYEALMSKGVPKDRLSQVHSPIGLEIGAETPEEIAISIVAELIKHRSSQNK